MWQLINWLPMALQALCRVSKETMSADSVAVLQTRSSPEKFLKFSMRAKTCHDVHVQNAVQGENTTHFGVKSECALSKALQHFHPITGFPPDILHDLFEGILPVELALCIHEMIHRKHFTLDDLNIQIQRFPYRHADRLDKPQVIPKNFAAKIMGMGMKIALC